MKVEIHNTISMLDGTVLSNRVYNHFQTMVPGARYLYAYKLFKKTGGEAGWDGKVSLLNEESRTVSTGLLPRLYSHHKSLKCTDMRNIAQPTIETMKVSLRDYQKEAISKAFNNSFMGTWFPRGIIKVATGGGKTEIAVAMTQMLNVPTIFLVHRKDLLIQAKERFEKYGMPVGVIGSGVFNPNERILIATMQTIAAIMRGDPTDPRFKSLMKVLRDTEQIFFDEAHLMASKQDKGNEFVHIANSFTKAYARWGLTATPFMRNEYDNLLLEGVAGPILYEVSNKFLIDKGYLTPPKITIIKSKGKKVVKRGTKWSELYDLGIVYNTERNAQIVEESLHGPFPTLVLTTRVEHHTNLEKLFCKSKKTIRYLSGSDSAEERAVALEAMRNGNLDIVVATTIWDEGVDIPNLRKVVLAGAGKSHVKALQRLGRGMRLADRKDVIEIIDFHDSQHKTLLSHSNLRAKYWEKEGFTYERKE